MTDELSLLLTLRRVLESARDGRGVAETLVRELRDAGLPGKEVAGKLLLGLPLTVSARSLLMGKSNEVAMLASLIVSSATSSAPLVGRNGEVLSYTLERWVKAKENRRLEERVLRFRSMIASAILGAVSGMLASLGPVLGSLNFSAGHGQASPGYLPYAAGVMIIVSSGLLGLFMARGRFYVNVVASTLAFVLVSVLVAPLASFPASSVWGIK